MNLTLLRELIDSGAKCDIRKIVFITKDKDGQLIWLEEGNEISGLRHILGKHAKDFENAFGIKEAQIPGFLEEVITSGDILSKREVIRSGRKGYEKVYSASNTKLVLTGIGSNGFIVSAYPYGEEEA